ncbi:MAG: hypothetical protein EXS55_00670 [Candidatus Magasanikbacteria bacterium]|nr:hypothetical protein [Candidatus Magasanikbacteria bacterium]
MGDLSFDFRLSPDEEALRPPKRVTIHAHSVHGITHMEWTPDGRLLASAFGGGYVVDVTEGGNMRGAKPFAWNLRHPAGLLTNYQGNRTLISDTGRGVVLDITKGGDAMEAPVFFAGVPGPYGLLSYQGEVFCTFSGGEDSGPVQLENGLVRMEEGGCFSEDKIRVRGFPNGLREMPYVMSMNGNKAGDCGCWTAVGYQGKMLYLHAGLGTVFDITNHTSWSPNMPFLANGLKKPLGMITHPTNGHLYVAERGGECVKVVPHDADGVTKKYDMRFVPPVACGFGEPSCVRFHPDGSCMYVCDFKLGFVWKVEF